MSGANGEAERRRAAAASGRADKARWSDMDNLEPHWAGRAKRAGELIPRGARVLDLGCGAMTLERHLPERCSYIPCDLVRRDERTIVCDFNSDEPPLNVDCDVIVALGVLEYLNDAPGFLRRLGATGKRVIFSYNPIGDAVHDRRALGWVNDFSRQDLPALITGAGFSRAASFEMEHGELLIQAQSRIPPRLQERTVWPISYFNAGNFGDRLGVQLLNHVLPPNAVVQHVTHKTVSTPPAGTPDLIVLGLGNSLYHEVLTDELIALLDRAPRKIGIFGTQYRDVMPVDKLQAVLDRLDVWYARSEEDINLFGRGRSNVRHLGDWMIDAFAMSRPILDETFEIRPEDVTNHPLDRVISKIQLYKRVTSSRLHPLLCALTSAEEVAYDEQDEFGVGASGKFRSLLFDVFGRDLPAQRLWPVDRSAVMTYKQKVRRNIDLLRDDVERALG